MEGLPVSEHHLQTARSFKGIHGISWEGPSNMLGMKSACFWIPYVRPNNIRLAEGYELESTWHLTYLQSLTNNVIERLLRVPTIRNSVILSEDCITNRGERFLEDDDIVVRTFTAVVNPDIGRFRSRMIGIQTISHNVQTLISWLASRQVSIPETQRIIIVQGSLQYFPPGDHVCWCLLEMEDDSPCKPGCPTVINNRSYVNCDETVVKELLRTSKPNHPRQLAFDAMYCHGWSSSLDIERAFCERERTSAN